MFGYFIEVSNSYKAQVPESYIRKQTLTTGERYTHMALSGRNKGTDLCHQGNQRILAHIGRFARHVRAGDDEAEILKNATSRSLVVLDEIGRGTSNFDGMSIARAVVEHIADPAKGLGCKTLFATHYHELTELEGTVEGVKNYNIAVKKRGQCSCRQRWRCHDRSRPALQGFWRWRFSEFRLPRSSPP